MNAGTDLASGERNRGRVDLERLPKAIAAPLAAISCQDSGGLVCSPAPRVRFLHLADCRRRVEGGRLCLEGKMSTHGGSTSEDRPSVEPPFASGTCRIV